MSDPPIDLRGAEESGVTESGDDRSLGELFGELSREFSQLMRQEVQLAKTELREEATKAGRAAGQLTGAAVAGHLCILLASLAAAWGLGEVIPIGFGLLIVAVVHGVVAAGLFARGRNEAKQIDLVPDETVETLKEDARWAKAQPK
jgi:hypothetical protein